ncbi:hypothetical protein BH23GEM6_BH23GEM6_01870 [soil metagenome]
MQEASSAIVPGAHDDDADVVRSALQTAASWLEAEGMARAELSGQLIRPMVALAGWRALRSTEPTPAFWWGALAVQLAHEASLLHDDVMDQADRRRGRPTAFADRGVGPALVQGDHLLTTAYRCAVRTGSPLFVELFARAVERTVAGELAQGRAAGRIIGLTEYEAIARGKAGELLGCALALAASLEAPERLVELRELGCRFGVVYQMLDDLLDLSPSTDTGKPALSDYAQQHWTWPLNEIQISRFGEDPREIVRALHADSGNGTAIERSMATLNDQFESLTAQLQAALGECALLTRMMEDWRFRAMAAVRTERVALDGSSPIWSPPSREIVARVPQEDQLLDYLSHHSKSFRFATRFFSAGDGLRVARVYAYCRFTDDLVDRPGTDPVKAASLLDEWMALSRRSYAGEETGIAFLDRVMRDMSEAGISFRHAEELAEGMRMDLRGERYASLAQLRVYTYRVASVVGLWISELFGVRDPATLQQAEAMGHAMQLTNIIRDIGEDLRVGRCYIPGDLMLRHGVDEEALRVAERLPPGYAALVEELIAAAEASYRVGFEGIGKLPRQLRLPVSIAAHVYRGILDEVRKMGNDNLRHRARTSRGRKMILAARAVTQVGLPPLPRFAIADRLRPVRSSTSGHS